MEAYAWCWRVKETQSYFYFRKRTFKNWNIGLPHLIILFFIVLCLYCISFLFSFYKLKVCGSPVLSKSIKSHFYTSICSLHVSVTIW